MKTIFSELCREEGIIKFIATSVEYNVIEVDKDRAYNVYLLRRNNVERSIEQKEQFDNVLQHILNYQGGKVVIHSMHFEESLFLFFTSIDADFFFGYISFGKAESII